MKTKIEKKFIYEGFGFPVELTNVNMVFIDKKWSPKIDIRKIANTVIKELPFQTERLTGNQVKFIRDYFEYSLRDFADEVNESHTAVAKWEKHFDKATKMDINIEIRLRLLILEKVAIKTAKDRKNFYMQYKEISNKKFTSNSPSPLKYAIAG